jgi:hypothetical protein
MFKAENGKGEPCLSLAPKKYEGKRIFLRIKAEG